MMRSRAAAVLTKLPSRTKSQLSLKLVPPEPTKEGSNLETKKRETQMKQGQWRSSNKGMLIDNPIWSSLMTTHAHLARGDSRARRYQEDINSLAGLVAPSRLAFDSLARLLERQERVVLFLDTASDLPDYMEIVYTTQLFQMICDCNDDWSNQAGYAAQNPDVKVIALGVDDTPAIAALGEVMTPMRLRPGASEIGNFIGVRDRGQLIAMAGERLRFPGYTEISGVCTHPEFEGRGLAAMLVTQMVKRIHRRGDTACLHVTADNPRAVKLYRRLKFKLRRSFQLVVLRLTGD